MILILPGMGANSSMYHGSWRELPDAVFMDWPRDYVPHNIPDLARHMAERVEGQVDHIAGSSLGGMVALEMADPVNAKSVTLIGSALSGQEVSGFLRTLTPLSAIAPLELCRRLAGKIDLDLTRMYAEQNPEFFRAMIRAIPDWSYNGDATVHRIHGRHDHVIQCEHADLWLDGGHLLAISHVKGCATAVREWCY